MACSSDDPPVEEEDPPPEEGRTVGLLQSDERATGGYTLYAPMSSTDTYLLDNDGLAVHSWASLYRVALSVYLLDDGSLLRTCKLDAAEQGIFAIGGSGGRIERIAWTGEVVWSYQYADSESHLPHHDVAVMPNGNVLMVAWERKTSDEAIAAGRDPDLIPEGEVWPDHVIEVEPDGESGGRIVWSWHAWDHLVQDFDPTKPNYGDPAENPGRIDLNHVTSERADWLHVNSIAYDAELDQIVLSVRTFDEVWVIDHDTTTEEAAGPAGDLLYRWGNPQAYGLGDATDQVLDGQHDATWIVGDLPGERRLLVFNNGTERGWSSVDEIELPLLPDGTYQRDAGQAFGPDALAWTYEGNPVDSFFSRSLSGAQRLANGHTLICDGNHGRFLEVTSAGEILWEYINPVTRTGILAWNEPVPTTPDGSTQNNVFRVERYPPDHPGLVGRDLTQGTPIEGE